VFCFIQKPVPATIAHIRKFPHGGTEKNNTCCPRVTLIKNSSSYLFRDLPRYRWCRL